MIWNSFISFDVYGNSNKSHIHFKEEICMISSEIKNTKTFPLGRVKVIFLYALYAFLCQVLDPKINAMYQQKVCSQKWKREIGGKGEEERIKLIWQ